MALQVERRWVVEWRIAGLLAEKWRQPYSVMVHYVRVRMALAIVRSNSLLIRGSRDRHQARRPAIHDRASMGDWWALSGE